MNAFLLVTIIPKYFKSATVSKDLLALRKLWLLVFSAFTYRPTFLLASNSAFLFLFMEFMFSTADIVSKDQKLLCFIQF